MSADFSQYNGTGYADVVNNINYDMVMGNGTDPITAYDAIGNILSMKQWGLKNGNSVVIDQLSYSYASNTNKLLKVVVVVNDGYHHLAEFKMECQSKYESYIYDNIGNLIQDNNKGLTEYVQYSGYYFGLQKGIYYNYLNLPQRVYKYKLDNGNTISWVTYKYDAAGVKIEKEVHATAEGAEDWEEKIITTTHYIVPFVYENDKLIFVTHEEGRVRITYNDQEEIEFQYDYFLKDHLGSVRSVITDEYMPPAIYQAGMEMDNRDFEVALFGENVQNTAVNKPGGFDSDSGNEKVSVLNGNFEEERVGPGVILKVMAGDKFSAKTFSWYQPTIDKSVDNNLSDLFIYLFETVVSGISSSSKFLYDDLDAPFVWDALENFMEDPSHPNDPARPKAYLNWVLLDDQRLQPVAGAFGKMQVPEITGVEEKKLLQLAGGDYIDIPVNGFLYVFISNESKGNVYFDDLRIEHIQGPLLEETHYYPFGLKMAGISSKAFGGVENRFKYNGK